MLCINNEPFIDTDEWIDIERLKSLEPDILKAISLAKYTEVSFGRNVIGYSTEYPGIKIIVLRNVAVYGYKNQKKHNIDSDNISLFESLMSYIYDLPFKEVGRIILFLNDPNTPSPIHTDGPQKPHLNDFLWLRTNLKKKFFIYDDVTEQKYYVEGYSAFFNEQCFHRTDTCPEASFSIRVDGFFTDEFKKQLKIDHITNYNST